MAQRWYYARGGQKIGPVTSQELRYLAASGTLQPTDLVWVEGNDRGKEARSVVGLFPAANGEGQQQPPPLPTERIADAGSTQGAVAASGSLVEKLGNLAETTKAAARLAAAQARKAHLVNVTLRAACLDLGRDIYAAGRFRDEFPDLFAQITVAREEKVRLGSVRVERERQKTLSGKAAEAATLMKSTAQAKLLTLKEESILRQLGESSYHRHGERTGREDLVRPIADCLSRMEDVDQEIDALSKFGQGRLITSKRVLVGALVCFVALIGFMALAPGAKDGSDSEDLIAGTSSRADEPRASRATIRHDPYTLVVMPSLPPDRVHRVPNESGLTPLAESKGVANLLGHEDSIRAVAIDPTGTTAASGDESGIVKLWNVGERKEIASFNVSEARRPVTAIAFSPSGELLFTACYPNRIWKVGDARPLRTLQEVEGWVSDAAFSPDGHTIAAVMVKALGRESSIQLWDTVGGRDIGVLPDSGVTVCLTFSPDGTSLASGLREGKLQIWDWKSRHLIRTLNAHAAAVSDIAYSPDGQLMASASSDKSCKVWEAGSGQQLRAIQHGEGVIFTAFLSGDGRLATVQEYSRSLRIWEPRSGREKKVLKILAEVPMSKNIATNGRVVVAGYGSHKYAQAVEVEKVSTDETLRPVAVKDLAQVDFSCGPNGEPIELEKSVTRSGVVAFERYFYRDRFGDKVGHGPYIQYCTDGIKRNETVYVHGSIKFTQLWVGERPLQQETYRGDSNHTRVEYEYYANGDVKSIGRYRVLHEVTATGESIRSIPHGLCESFYDNTLVKQKGLHNLIAGVHQQELYEDGKRVGIAVYNRDGKLVKGYGLLDPSNPRRLVIE